MFCSEDGRERMPRAIRRTTGADDPEVALLGATLRLIGRGGFDRVTHRAVAGEAKVSLGAVTHHFKTRDELVDRALRFAVSNEVARLRDLVLALQGGAFDVEAWIAGLVGSYADDLKRNAEIHVACFEVFLAASRGSRYRPLIDELRETWRSSTVLALRAAGSADPEAHAAIFVATLIGLLLQQLAMQQRSFAVDAATTLLELVNRITKPPAADARRYVSPARRKPSR
jgi:TetR/AcrR family transcriptional regulator, regulator of biofilm formation and stress response